MKKSTLTLVAIMFISGIVLNGCSIGDAQVNDAQERLQTQNDLAYAKQDVEETSSDSMKFQKFKNESNEIINDNAGRIAELKINIKNEKTEAKENYGRDVDALERKNRELKRRLADYQDDGKTDWRKFKRGFNHDLDALGDDFKNFNVKVTK